MNLKIIRMFWHKFLNVVLTKPIIIQSDYEALKSDWDTVGNDFRAILGNW